jgi:hypothetical protein
VVRYWEQGAPENGLDTPLKDWASLFSPSDYEGEAVKFGNVRSVYAEFQNQCMGDYDRFEEKFPGLRGKFTLLLKAVRKARQARGEAKTRRNRK